MKTSKQGRIGLCAVEDDPLALISRKKVEKAEQVDWKGGLFVRATGGKTETWQVNSGTTSLLPKAQAMNVNV